MAQKNFIIYNIKMKFIWHANVAARIERSKMFDCFASLTMTFHCVIVSEAKQSNVLNARLGFFAC